MNIPFNIKRRALQIAAFGFTNPYLGNFVGGKLYKGDFKQFCSPGLNCYSCPAAALSCPIGAMQAVAGTANFSVSFYCVGFVLALGAIFGRAICGFACPFGFLQELLYKIPFPKLKLAKSLRYVKYLLLALLVIILPAAATSTFGLGTPWFCEYVCPVGTLEAGIPLLATHPELHDAIGWLFAWKTALLIITLLGVLSIQRFFCKVACPLGAIYGLLNKVSLLRLRYMPANCNACGSCARVCPMEIVPVQELNSFECIRCGACVHACPGQALKLSFAFKNDVEAPAKNNDTETAR